MTDKQPEALRLAAWLHAAAQICPQLNEDEPGGYASEVDQVMDEAAFELRRLHAENEALRMGYEAARLEIESLKAQLAEPVSAPESAYQRGYLDGIAKGRRDAKAPSTTEGDVFRALVEFLLIADEPLAFLRCWGEGDFTSCKKEWPEAPESLYQDTCPTTKPTPQQEQEPVAWLSPWRADQVTTDYDAYGERGIPLYTAPQQEAHHLAQALTDRENQPNQYGVEFGMSGPQMHFKIGNQLFRLAYEPDEQEEFDFMKRMLVHAFTTFTHDVKTAPQPAQAAPAAVAGQSEFPHEKMDAVALGRYKVVSSDQSMFYRFAVVAGDGTQQLYIGREVDCQNMARKFAGAFLDGAFAYHSMTAAPTTQPAPQQEAQEPVAWQSRTRPTWEGNTSPWSPWKPCTKEQAEDCWKTPLLHEWAYAARALYTAPPPSPAPLSDDLRDRLVAISEAIADQDDRAAQAMLREILKAPQPSPAAQGDALDAPVDAAVQQDAGRWRRLVNASELSFPVATIADDPENDAVMLYGRKALEDFVDLMDEIPNTYDAARAAQEGASHEQ